MNLSHTVRTVTTNSLGSALRAVALLLLCLTPTWTLGCSGSTNSAGQGPTLQHHSSTANCNVGPGGFCWTTYADPGGTVSWAAPLTAAAAQVSGVAPSDGSVGMRAQLDAGNPVDLSKFDLLWFDADIPSGSELTTYFDNPDGSGCLWSLYGVGQARYSVDLTAAEYCWQTNCGVARSQAVAVGFQPYGWGGTIDMTVTNLGFAALANAIEPVTTGSGATRLDNGLCWSLFAWGAGASSIWATPPDASHAHVKATNGPDQGYTGLIFELPANQQSFTTFEFDASVALSGSSKFFAQMQDKASGAPADFGVTAASGSSTYSLQVAGADTYGTASGHVFDPSAIARVLIGTNWGVQMSADIDITRVAVK